MGPFEPNDTPPSDTGVSGPKVQSLGNGYSLVIWTTKVYDPVSQGMIDKEQSQIVPDKDAATIAAQAQTGATAISNAGANQRAAVQAEIDRARDAANAAHQAAVDALAQGNAAEARRQFDISSKELQRSHDMDASFRQQDADLAKQKFGFDVYKNLSDLASNPRNYMEQFFRFRGSPVPEGAGQYSNLAPFQQFLPNLLAGLGLSSSGAGAAAGASRAPATAASNPRAGGAFMPGLFGSAANPNPMPTPVQAGPPITELKAGATTPNIPSQYFTPTGAGAPGQMFQGVQGTPIAFNAHADAPIVGAPGGLDQPKQYAGGGTLRMTAPHAIINLLTGKVAAIAGEAGPETAKFDGAALIDEKAADYGGDVPPVDPMESVAPPSPPKVPGGGGLAYPTTTENLPTTTGDTGPVPAGPGSPIGPTPPVGTPPPLPAPLAIPPPTAPAINPLNYMAPPEPLGPPVGYVPPGDMTPEGPRVGTPSGGSVPGPVVAPPSAGLPVGVFPGETTGTGGVSQPLGGSDVLHPQVEYNPATPWVGGYQNGVWVPPSGVPARPPSFNRTLLEQLQSLAQTPSGLGKNPTFLPEDAAQANPIVGSLVQNNAFPPFLQRIFAQQAGLAGLGTNVPQQTNLPPGVPLTSRLALNQMSPSELSAFQSFISANGVDWNDYLNMVDAASPHGAVDNLRSIPKFLSQ